MSGATNEQLNALSKPMARNQVKTDTRHGKKIYYVTARTVMNRLDDAVGRANWQTQYRVVKPSDPLTVECTLMIRVDGEWVGKADVGTEDNYSPEKAAWSNSLKRAGAQWGIARELYGEGNVYEEDDDSPNAGIEPQPAPRPTTPPASTPKPDKRAAQTAPAVSAGEATTPESIEHADVDTMVSEYWPNQWVQQLTLKKTVKELTQAGFNIGAVVYPVATSTLGYKDDAAVKAKFGINSSKDFDGTLLDLLRAVVQNAPALVASAAN